MERDFLLRQKFIKVEQIEEESKTQHFGSRSTDGTVATDAETQES